MGYGGMDDMDDMDMDMDMWDGDIKLIFLINNIPTIVIRWSSEHFC